MRQRHTMRTRIPAALILLGLLGVSGCDNTPAASSAEFNQADSNHDGRLTSEEYKRLVAIRAAGGDQAAAQAVKSNLQYDTYSTRFRNSDSNGDGYLSRDEMNL